MYALVDTQEPVHSTCMDDPESPFELVSRRLEREVKMILLIHPGCAFEELEGGIVIAVGSEDAVVAQVEAHNC